MRLSLRLKIIFIVIPLIIVFLNPLIYGVEISVFWGVEISDTFIMVIVIIFWGIVLFYCFPED